MSDTYNILLFMSAALEKGSQWGDPRLSRENGLFRARLFLGLEKIVCDVFLHGVMREADALKVLRDFDDLAVA